MKENLKSKRGITLIALVITIIILLILAIITINLLLSQGIIGHANNAVHLYNEAQNNELAYLTYAEGEMDKYAGATGSGSGETYTPPAEDVDALKKYFMGTKEDGSINEEGQSLWSVLDMEKSTEENFVFIDDEATIGSGSNVSMVMAPYTTFKDDYYYIKYKNQDAYRLVVNISSFNVEDVAFVYSPQGAEGETREYKGEQWTVLYDKGTTLELVSPKTIGTYTLGSNDVEKAIDSYNNAVNRLNAFCRDTLKDDTARCVGSNPASPDSDNPGMYTSSNLASWAEGAYNGVGKKADDNGEQDFVRMLYHGVNVAKDSEGNDTSYWLASRFVNEYPSIVYFGVYCVDGGRAGGRSLWDVYSSDAYGHSPSVAVRPVVRVAK